MSRLRDLLHGARAPLLAILAAFALGAILIVLTDFDHLRLLGSDPGAAIGGAVELVLRGYGAMLSGAIGDPGRIVRALQSGSERDIASAIRPLTEALLFSTPLIFLSLGVGVSFQAGLFNLGGNGQFVIGALGATIGASVFAGVVPPFAVLIAALATGTLFGAAYGFLPGLLKARTGAHEVITTLMLNTIAAQIVIYAVRNGAFAVPATATVPRLVDLPTVRLDWSFVVALLTAAAVSFVLFRTSLGFELRATGFSRTVSRNAGMRPGRVTILAMSLSGGLAGMGGAFLTLGPAGGLGPGASMVALALALIGGLRPSGIVLVAILYGALNNGAKTMVIATGIPLDLLVVIIALALTFVAAPGLIGSVLRRPGRSPAPG